MNKRASVITDLLFVVAIAFAVASAIMCAVTDGQWQSYFLEWACFCLVMAVLACVYPSGR